MAYFRKRGCICEDKKKCKCGAKWEYRVKFIDRRTGKQKEVMKGGFRTKKEAQLTATEVESNINYLGFDENGNEKVEKFFGEWLEVYENYQPSKEKLVVFL